MTASNLAGDSPATSTPTLEDLADAGRSLHHECTMGASAIRGIARAIDREGVPSNVRALAHALEFVADGLDNAGNLFDEADIATAEEGAA